jgi:predicted flavoprotein YhiN
MFDLIVIGGGPAGMMAAGRAGERGRSVLLVERGPAVGRKLLTTATGRCNVTNSADLESFLRAFGRQGGFLRDAFRCFDNQAMLEWLHNRGVETVEERKGRVFPASQKAETVLKALTDFMAAGRVEVRLGHRVESLWTEAGQLRGVVAAGERIEAKAALIATGGLSYPGTGSSGDGYRLARQAGHTLVEPWPAIVALETREEWPARIQGTPIKNVAIVATVSGSLPVSAVANPAVGLPAPDASPSRSRKIAEIFGEALWTHYGISGPAVLDISREVVPALLKGAGVELQLDLRPGDSDEALDERLLFAIKREGKKQVDGVLGELIAARTARLLLELNEIDPRKKMNQVSKSDRKRILRAVKHLTLQVTRPRPITEAIVTGGGIPLAEIDPRRMESKLLAGLHFAGEVVDLAGPSGGYNLQSAFSTGFLVGESV